MKVSFVIPTYNSVTWVVQAVKSCLTQTHKDIEVIVVNDGSTDNTIEAFTNEWIDVTLESKKKDLVKLINNTANLGRSASRNIGNEAATGDIICVLDADDLNTPQRAEITAGMFKNGAKFIYGSAVVIDVCGTKIKEIVADVFNKDKAFAAYSNGIVHSTCAYSKELATKYKYLDGEAARLGVDDYCLQVQMAMDGVEFKHTTKFLSAYRPLAVGVSSLRDEGEAIAFKKGFLDTYKVHA